MAIHTNAPVREEAPHANRTTRTNTIINALTRRAQAVLNDESIDPQTRAILRYALKTNDPWLAEFVRRADAREAIIDTTSGTLVDTDHLSQTDSAADDDSPLADRISALADLICRGGDEPGTKSAALMLLMAAVENAPHPKALANTAKHLAFTRCGELNLHGMVDTQIATLELELLAESP